MRRFKDAEGREWNIPPLDPFRMREVRTAIGVNLSKQSTFQELVDDKLLVLDVLTVLLKKQAAKLELSPDAFAAIFCDPEVADEAHGALLLGLADFFPKSKREAFLRLTELEKQDAEVKLARLKALETADPKAVQSILNSSAGSSPASLASVPPASASVS